VTEPAKPGISEKQPRRAAMPVIVLWAIPAIIVLGGGAYWIAHIH
jgi:hypothetical protein